MGKTFRLVSFPFALLVAGFVMGCSDNVDSLESTWTIGEVDSALYGQGDPSIITPNSLDSAALAPSDLGRYPLSISGMSPTTAALVTGPNGALVRKLLRYAVGCALDKKSEFDFSWIDETGTTHSESYGGDVGLVQDWPNRALDVAEQERVSACLAARTNWYGEAVRISMRGNSSVLDVNNGEQHSYSVREGAFWGNLFSTTPFLRACYDADNVLYSRSRHRDCAAGHVEDGTVLECGIIGIVGSCQQTCVAPTTGGYYPSCAIGSGSFPAGTQALHPITTFLH